MPFGLNPPGPDPMLASESTFELAVEQGAAKEFAPISLDADGSATHGVIFDRFRLLARAARAAAAAGTPIDIKQPPRELMRTGMVVVAHPLRCGDKEPVPPASIEITPAQGPAPQRTGELATGETLARLIPNVRVPAGSMGAAFPHRASAAERLDPGVISRWGVRRGHLNHAAHEVHQRAGDQHADAVASRRAARDGTPGTAPGDP